MKNFILHSPHRRILELGKAVMGILNVTPDSFSDGGDFLRQSDALKHAKKLIEDGADIIDIGGESTRPDAKPVPIQEELRRVIPVIRSIRKSKWGRKVWISVDTYKAEVARQAVEAGADMVNDVTALRGDPQMAKVVSEMNVPVVLMYSKDPKPPTTRKKVRYHDVIKTILKFFRERIAFARKNRIRSANLILDPGMGGFVSMVPEYSFEILRRLPELKKLGFALLIGTSRKSFLSADLDVKSPSFFSAWYALEQGASIVRAHDTADLKNFL